jgi:hypothetical protein
MVAWAGRNMGGLWRARERQSLDSDERGSGGGLSVAGDIEYGLLAVISYRSVGSELILGDEQ